MSDIADRAIWRIEKGVHNAMAHIRKQPMLETASVIFVMNPSSTRRCFAMLIAGMITTKS